MNSIQTVTINQSDISVKEYNRQRVVTFKDIDACHNRAEGTAGRNFRNNKQHFIEGEDFFVIELTNDEIRRQFGAGKNAGKTMNVLTESGYLMLVKSFTDDLAWDVQRQLVNSYFRVEKQEADNTLKIQIQQERSKAMMLNAKSRIANQMMKIWSAAGVEPQYQALAMNNYYDGLSVPRIALKCECTAMYDLTTIAKHLGVMSKNGKPHAQAVGAIVEKLKPLDEGECQLTPYSRNGHDDVSMQYTLSVEHKIKTWLEDNLYPNPIAGNGKNYMVTYKN